MRAAIGVLLLAGSAHAATVAVMPFKDLSGGTGSVGEAIRETVTTDLKALADVKVVERGQLDRILVEQKLQAQRADLDPSTVARVGKLLGATLIVTGAYQEAPPQVRLTARFVKVETGEIVGTAKVDGKAGEFLRLQDRVTAELLRSAGMGGHAKKIVQRARPTVKSLKAIDLYGQAVTADSDDRRRELLVASLAEDASFSYAASDLAALEKRMKGYQAAAQTAQDQKLREAREALAKEKDPAKSYQLAMQVLNGLVIARRYRALIVEARALMAHPPPSAMPGTPSVEEIAAYYIVVAENGLKERDALLRDGEVFLRKHAGSMYFRGVQSIMEAAIAEKRKIEEGRGAVAGEVAKLPSSARWDLCRVAQVHRSHHQHASAQRLLRACLQAGSSTPRGGVLRDLVWVDIDAADWTSARRDLAALEKEDQEEWHRLKSAFESLVPTDG